MHCKTVVDWLLLHVLIAPATPIDQHANAFYWIVLQEAWICTNYVLSQHARQVLGRMPIPAYNSFLVELKVINSPSWQQSYCQLDPSSSAYGTLLFGADQQTHNTSKSATSSQALWYQCTLQSIASNISVMASKQRACLCLLVVRPAHSTQGSQLSGQAKKACFALSVLQVITAGAIWILQNGCSLAPNCALHVVQNVLQ